MDHVQRKLKTLEAFKSIGDTSLAAPGDDLVKMVYEIITKCLDSHSERPSSSEVQ